MWQKVNHLDQNARQPPRICQPTPKATNPKTLVAFGCQAPAIPRCCVPYHVHIANHHPQLPTPKLSLRQLFSVACLPVNSIHSHPSHDSWSSPWAPLHSDRSLPTSGGHHADAHRFCAATQLPRQGRRPEQNKHAARSTPGDQARRDGASAAPPSTHSSPRTPQRRRSRSDPTIAEGR